MPPVSQKQRALFRWAAENPGAAEKRGIKPSVAKEFNAADSGGKLPEKVKSDRTARQKTLYDRSK